jgi:hypothetical protein
LVKPRNKFHREFLLNFSTAHLSGFDRRRKVFAGDFNKVVGLLNDRVGVARGNTLEAA